MCYYKMDQEQLKALKREVKKATGRNMNTISILAYDDKFIYFGYYETKYAELTNNLTRSRITRSEV